MFTGIVVGAALAACVVFAVYKALYQNRRIEILSEMIGAGHVLCASKLATDDFKLAVIKAHGSLAVDDPTAMVHDIILRAYYFGMRDLYERNKKVCDRLADERDTTQVWEFDTCDDYRQSRYDKASVAVLIAEVEGRPAIEEVG